MVTGEHVVIRAVDSDDAPALRPFYDPERPRSCLLDQRREPFWPTLDELREAVTQKEMGRNILNAIEDTTGRVRGFCAVRSLNLEVRFAEFIVLLEDADYAEPLASETFDFLIRQAFQQLKLNKVISHTLDSETAFRAFLLAHGFESNGVQREVFFGQGRYYDMEGFSLLRSATCYGQTKEEG